MNRPDILTSRTRQEIRKGLWLDSALALFLEPEKALIVSDLHWGYAKAHRHYGNLFPQWGDETIAQRLHELLDAYRPGQMFWLGDSIHDAVGCQSADHFLESLPRSLEVHLIGGNHDRRWKKNLLPSCRVGNYFLHHGDQSPEVPEGLCEIVGHWHPALNHYDGAGLSLKLPVLVEQPSRLVMPAFSPWSKGTHWQQGVDDALWIASPRRIWKKPV